MAVEDGDIVMAGPDAGAPGGISAVIRTWDAAGLSQRWPIRPLSTWQAGSWASRGLTALAAAHRLHTWLQEGRVQAVHLHAAGRGSFWRKATLSALTRRQGRPVILHLHDGTFLPWWWAQPAPVRQMIRQELQRADRLIVLDEHWARVYSEWAPGARLRVLPNPVAVAGALDHRTVVHGAGVHDAPASPRPVPGRVLFLSRLWPSKGLDELLQAVSALRMRVPQLQLQCAGDGDLPAVRRRAAELGIADRVELTGWLDGADKQRALEQAQLLVLPSWAEGQPVAVLEAMAAGTPVLATAVGGVPGLLAEGGGVLVPPRDVAALTRALGALLRDPRRCRAMGAIGRKAVLRRHEAHRVVDRLDALYRSMGLKPRREN